MSATTPARTIRPLWWVAILTFALMAGGIAMLLLLRNPFDIGTTDARALKFSLTIWVISAAAALAGGFRFIGWRSYRLTDDWFESRMLWSRRRYAWADLLRADPGPRRTKLVFKNGSVTVLTMHHAKADMEALDKAMKAASVAKMAKGG